MGSVVPTWTRATTMGEARHSDAFVDMSNSRFELRTSRPLIKVLSNRPIEARGGNTCGCSRP